MEIFQENNSVRVQGVTHFDVEQTFDCGQSFRFEIVRKNTVQGVSFGKKIEIFQPKSGTLILTPCNLQEFGEYWQRFLALDEDYSAIRAELARLRGGDFTLKNAMESGTGIRILRQDPWETLVSFIISQNNNIPRIKKNIADLCEKYGENGAFPSAKTLADLSIDDLRALKVGFRAPYIHDAATKVVSGEVDLQEIFALSTETAAEKLMKIKGVGAKVAACVLLFGFGKYDAFPVDVWMKRVLHEFYGDGTVGADFGAYAGIAQQYLFYYRRYLGGNVVKI